MIAPVSEVALCFFWWLGVALRPLLQGDVFSHGAAAAGAPRWEGGALQAVAPPGPALLRPIMTGTRTDQSLVLLSGGGRARGGTTPCAAVVVEIRPVAVADAAAFGLCRVAVGVAVLLLDILPQPPPPPPPHHL